MGKQIFLICPVRFRTGSQNNILNEYMKKQISNGYNIYNPFTDTDHNDSIGLEMCLANKEAMINSHEVHIFYHSLSFGSVFDSGMAFMANKPINVINKTDLNESYFEKILLTYCDNYPDKEESQLLKQLNIRKLEINSSDITHYVWIKGNEKKQKFLFDFGMSFMSDSKILLSNPYYTSKYKTDDKSFQNVLLELDRINRN